MTPTAMLEMVQIQAMRSLLLEREKSWAWNGKAKETEINHTQKYATRAIVSLCEAGFSCVFLLAHISAPL